MPLNFYQGAVATCLPHLSQSFFSSPITCDNTQTRAPLTLVLKCFNLFYCTTQLLQLSLYSTLLMASLQDHSMKLQFCSSYLPSLPRFHQLQCLNFPQKPFSGKVKLVFPCPESYKTKGDKVYSVCCFCKTKDAEIDKVEDKEQDERPPFDINLAVILAGFAFEAYTTPSVSNFNLIFLLIFVPT